MDIFSILLIALGLAMDAFAVSVACGFAIKALRVKHAFTIAVSFGLFQALMPMVGWASGTMLKDLITGIDHWIAFTLLSIIGGKMIYESFKIGRKDEKFDPQNPCMLLILSIATSIDALAVGITLSFLDVAIMMPALIIGIITFLLSFLGVFIGNKFGHFFEKRIEAVGGIILIGIGIKILLEHLL
ncbi:MAG: manganese efflux pump MntP family protein [bacterium]